MLLPMPLTSRTATEEDFEALVDLRTRSMRKSLERIGRFDPHRVRARLRDTFAPSSMQLVLQDGSVVGCVTVRAVDARNAWVEHFYLEPSMQGRGIGTAMIKSIHAHADAEGCTLRLSVLRGSEANAFYLKHGYRETQMDDFDVYYGRTPARSGGATP
jgi:GNAT superfamily N-acetyltransferase